MTAENTERRRKAAAVSVRENQGGAPGCEWRNHRYMGRSVEADRSWIAYHAFASLPVYVGDDAMTGLSQSDATSCILSLNLRNAERSSERIRLPSNAGKVQERAECGS